MTEPRRSDAAREGPVCPTCGGAMWDNTTTKRNPRAPDFKCRDRSCSGVIWHYKGPQRHPAAAAGPRASRPQPIGPVVARVLGSIGAESVGAAARSDSPRAAEALGPRDRAPGSPPPPPGWLSSHGRALSLYRASVRYIGRRIVPLCATFGVSIPADAFAAMVATVFVALHEESRGCAPEQRRGVDA